MKRELSVTEYSLTQEDRKAFVIDNIFPESGSQEIYSYFKDLSYRFVDSDRPDTTHIKHLMHQFPEAEWKENPLLCVSQDFTQSFLASQRLQAKETQRIYANFNLFGDFQYTHRDGDEWTALFFINSRWDADWGGELFLYSDERAETAIAVRPKPGRAVIFDGMILHRGGVPSKLCFEPRITLAIKTSRRGVSKPRTKLKVAT
jgi:SM-20-related protein